MLAHSQFVPVTRYTTRDGMFTERITSMTQDSKGYMWFGTYFGVMRYDGYQWQHYQLPGNMKNKFVSDVESVGDKIYAAGWGGLAEIEKGVAKTVQLPSGYTDAQFLQAKHDSVLILVLYDNNPYKMAIWELRKSKFKLISPIPQQFTPIISLRVDNRNRIWLGTEKGALYIESGKLIQFIKDTSVLITQQRDEIVVTTPISEGKTLVRSYDSKNARLSKAQILKGVVIPQKGDSMATWGFDGDRDAMLIRLEKNGAPTNYPFQLPKRTVLGPLFVDREQNTWFSTEAGLYKFSNLKASAYYFQEKGPESTAILPIGSKMLVTNGVGCYLLAEGKLAKISNLAHASSLLFQKSNGDILISYWVGVSGLSIQKFVNKRFYTLRKFKGSFSSFFEDDSGTIWSSGNGINILQKDGRHVNLPVSLPEESNVQLINLLVDQHNKIIWGGTSYYGLIKMQYQLSHAGDYTLKVVDRLDMSKGLADNTIRGNLLKDSKGNIWVGTRNNGLSCFREQGGKYIIRNFSESDGITCSRINRLVEHRGFIWAAACNGVYQLNESGMVKKYTTGDGLIEDYVLDLNFDEDTMWVGTSEGITRLLLTDEIKYPPPPVAISQVWVLGNADSSLYNTGITRFSSHQNSIGFTFTANSFINERKVLYKYRLYGFEKKWSRPTISNNINYASLPSGMYTFQVLAQNAKGIWSTSPATFQFEIVLPFYKTMWFAILLVLLIGGTVYLLYAYRRSQLLRVEKMRRSIARDLHDDIGSALGSINILSKTALRKMQGDEEVKTVVDKIGNTAQKTLESMDEIIWFINPAKEKAEDLALRMQNFAQPLLESEGIEFSFSSSVDHQKVGMNLKRNLYLVFKELVFNATRHSGATKVEASLYAEQKTIVMRVADNGKGMSNIQHASLRNGLTNIRDRVASLHGDLIVNSQEGSGTVCMVKIPAV